MKKLLPLALSFTFILAVAGHAANGGPIRVLFLGHEDTHHNSNAYVPLLMEKMGRDAIYFDYFTKPDCLNAETLSHYDAVMLYANHEQMAPAQFEALNSFVESGHGFLPIHCASACFGNDPRFVALVGGRFKSHGTGVFKSTIVDKSHPIMQGVKEWETWDETYVHDQLNAQGRKLLMERVDGEKHEPWTWVREQGKGRVFYTASGHDERTWKNTDFQQMLRNAIVWAVGDKVKTDWEGFLTKREPEKREPNPNVANYEKRPQTVTFQHPFSVKGSVERTQVPADMRLELFASEPDISKPIAMAWDARGRCWIAETSDYPHGVSPNGEGHDRIKICEDTDGDGKADKFTVFADKLNIPTSIVFANGGVIVAQPPRFLFLKDTNGDDKADVREVIMEGWGVRDTHAQASNLHWGFDNWLYGCVGYSGFKGTVGGKAKEFGMGTYRFKADGSELEFLHQFSNNSWGQSTNAAGDQFGGTANNAPIFYGGIPATAFPAGMRGMSAKKINVEDKAHAITPNYRQVDVFGGYTAAAGSAFMYSTNLPERLQGKALVCEPTMKLISVMDVQPDGAGYVAKDGFNLVASSDEWMSPVFAEVGPDGAVWFADWQNFIIQHNPTPTVERGGYAAKTGVGGAHENDLRDHARGRIYRVVWEKAGKPAIRSLDKASTPELVKALASDTQFWRLTAQRLLVEGKRTDAIPQLKQVVAANDGSIGAVHALWTLHGLGALDEAMFKGALSAKDPALRRNAIRALGNSAKAQALLSDAVSFGDPEPHTRLAALVKLADFPSTPEMTTLAGKLRADASINSDAWLREAGKLLARKYGAGSTGGAEGPNLLPNPSFETTSGDLPQGWQLRHYKGQAKWDLAPAGTAAHSGKVALHVKSQSGADTSVFVDVPVQPDTEYKLSAWIRTKGVVGAIGALLNVHGTEFRTEPVTRDSDWTLVDAVFNSGKLTKVSVNCLFGGYGQSTGEAWFDDVKLCELGADNMQEKALTGDPKRGEEIFFKHGTVACVLCHQLKGQGSTVGPALDGIASRKDAAYIEQSLLEPNKVLAKGYEALGASPMPPMGLILKPQELADIKAYLQTLK
ncbi:PVC-type heme-binding CxxCH protein [Verrucomicrobiota bacterium sgz303538]